MSFDPQITPGTAINNQELCTIFKCSTQGGMRRSHSTNTLVIISNHIESVYDDRWIKDDLHYTGMGLEGDQRLDAAQNKTLAESGSNGVTVHLFEVYNPQEYTYTGRVLLADKPYQEQQPDKNGKPRSVWIFPLKLDQHRTPIISEEQFRSSTEKKAREARKLSDEELSRRASFSSRQAGSRQVTTKQYERSPWVSELAKRRANGICQLCNQPAPFKGSSGNPYLETHHIKWLSKDGEDCIENAVALCPNCHRKMHILDPEDDREWLMQVAVAL